MKHLKSLLAGLSLAVVTAGLSTPANADGCKSATLIKNGTEYTVELKNTCQTDVFWAYNACIGAKSVENGKARVQPGQTFAAKFKYDLIGTPTLFENACEGNCLAPLPECPKLLNLPGDDTSGDDDVASALQDLLAEPPAQKPSVDKSFKRTPEDTDPNGSSIYDRLSSLDDAQEESPERPLKDLLIEKPTSKPVAIEIEKKPEPASEPKPVLNAKPVTLPENVGVKPVQPPKTGIKLGELQETDQKALAYKAASCVWTEMGQRNWLGQSALMFHNSCGKPVVVGLRTCVKGKPDQQAVFPIKQDSVGRRGLSHPKGEKPTYAYKFCTSEGCAPELPKSCSE